VFQTSDRKYGPHTDQRSREGREEGKETTWGDGLGEEDTGVEKTKGGERERERERERDSQARAMEICSLGRSRKSSVRQEEREMSRVWLSAAGLGTLQEAARRAPALRRSGADQQRSACDAAR
jgi:hypothetical protein